MLRGLWLLFAQSVTVALGAVTVFSAFYGFRPGLVPTADGKNIVCDSTASRAVDKAAPAVVTIFARHDLTGHQSEQIGTNWNSLPELNLNALGSGAIVSADGFILTNYHVISAVQGLYVRLADGRQFEAVLVGSDIDTDLALLKISDSDLPTLTIGRSDNLRVGQPVLAIGNPFDVGQTVTAGIISALGRHGLGLNSYEDFIQTDAAINQGNSGGALVNLQGELIGINTAIFSPDHAEGFVGIGFAIPSTIIERVLPSLKAGKIVERGYFGFVPRQLSPEFAQDIGLAVMKGVMVSTILPNSPAAKGGLRPFDVLLSINGENVTHIHRMLQQIAAIKPGTEVPIVVLRDKKEILLTLTAVTRPRNAAEREGGLPSAVDELAEEEARQMELKLGNRTPKL